MILNIDMNIWIEYIYVLICQLRTLKQMWRLTWGGFIGGLQCGTIRKIFEWLIRLFQARRTFYAKFQKNCGNDEVTQFSLVTFWFWFNTRCAKPNCQLLLPSSTGHQDPLLVLHRSLVNQSLLNNNKFSHQLAPCTWIAYDCPIDIVSCYLHKVRVCKRCWSHSKIGPGIPGSDNQYQSQSYQHYWCQGAYQLELGTAQTKELVLQVNRSTLPVCLIFLQTDNWFNYMDLTEEKATVRLVFSCRWLWATLGRRRMRQNLVSPSLPPSPMSM